MRFKCLQVLVILSVFGVSLSAFSEESERQVVYIHGQTYTVEYKLNDEGKLEAKPIAVKNNQGGWNYLKEENQSFIAQKATNGIPVNFNGKTYSVRFSQDGSKIGAQVYAVSENGRWNYLEESANPYRLPKTITPQSPATAKPKTPSVASAAPTNSESLAEFQLYDKAVGALASTTHETTPVLKNGNWVYPNVTITAKPRIQNSNNSANLALDVDVVGDSTSSGGQVVLGRYTGATVNTNINGHFSREALVTPDGVQAGALRGDVDIEYEVQPYTEFRMRFLAKRALKKASGQASSQAEAQIPREKQMIRNEIFAKTGEAFNQSSVALQKGMAEASEFAKDAKKLPYHLAFSSKAPTTEKGYVAVALKGAKKEGREPRPTGEKQQQAAAALFLHEDAINGIISPLLAGKKINLGEAMKIICDNNITKKLAFCQEKMDEKLAGTTVLFDEENPFKISFRDDQVKVEINAVHSNSLAKGNPYKIEAVYDVSDDGMKRKSVKVTPRGEAQPQPQTPSSPGNQPATPELAQDEAPKKAEHAGNYLGDFLSSAYSAYRFIADPAEKKMLEDAYGNAFKEEVSFPAISLPNAVHTSNPKAGGQGQLVAASSYVPLEAKSEKGWFMASNFSCPSGGASLGINFQIAKNSEGAFLKITQVVAGSPADVMGFKVGDFIRTYNRAGKEKTTVIEDFSKFQNAVAEAAAEKETEKRLFQIEGRHADGKSFAKTVTLCPKGIDPMKGAQELISKVSKSK